VWQKGPHDPMRGLQGQRQHRNDAVQYGLQSAWLAVPRSRQELLTPPGHIAGAGGCRRARHEVGAESAYEELKRRRGFEPV
jgi:hypothetical protein